jgi:hypothetical protein
VDALDCGSRLLVERHSKMAGALASIAARYSSPPISKKPPSKSAYFTTRWSDKTGYLICAAILSRPKPPRSTSQFSTLYMMPMQGITVLSQGMVVYFARPRARPRSLFNGLRLLGPSQRRGLMKGPYDKARQAATSNKIIVGYLPSAAFAGKMDRHRRGGR